MLHLFRAYNVGHVYGGKTSDVNRYAKKMNLRTVDLGDVTALGEVIKVSQDTSDIVIVPKSLDVSLGGGKYFYKGQAFDSFPNLRGVDHWTFVFLEAIEAPARVS